MKTKISSLLLLSLAFISVNAQTGYPQSNPPQATPTVDTTQYQYDTAKTVCQYVGDLNTGSIASSYCIRILKSKMDYKTPTLEDLKKDSFVVKKQMVPVGVEYYVPVLTTPPATKKDKNPKSTLNYVKIPVELILQDYNKNFDYLLQQPKK